MGRPKRNIQAAAEESTTPPDSLEKTQSLARVVKVEGNSLYTCGLPNGKTVLVELAVRFRNTIWIRRGGYVLVDIAFESEGKVDGDIVNVVRDEREWRKRPYWPKEFAKNTQEDDSGEDESKVGKMPPSNSEED